MMMRARVDVGFPAKGTYLPLDHGFLLFRAICDHLPQLFEEHQWGVHPVSGRRVGPARLALFQHSLVQLRVPVMQLGEVMALGARSLHVGTYRVQLGLPSVYPLHPAKTLRSRCVSVRGLERSRPFTAALREELEALALPTPLGELDVLVGERSHIRARDHWVTGFEVTVGGLDAESSVCLQQRGLGGHRHLGLGLLTPYRGR